MVKTLSLYITLLTALNLFFPTILVDCYNPKHLARSKREDPSPPQTITIHLTVRHEVKDFKVSKLEDHHIANSSLKTWTVHTRGSESDRSNMEKYSGLERVGPWIMYQNFDDKSAVVYFPKHKLMIGILGKKYHLDYVSYSGTEECNVTIPYTADYGRRKREIDSLEEWTNNFSLSNRLKRSVEETSDERNYQFYLESMVFISGNGIEPLPVQFDKTDLKSKKADHYIIHVLSFFNVVDMFFTKVPFKINIAGIAVRQDGSDFPFYENGAFDTGTQKLQLRKANDVIIKFISKQKKDFPPDSLDLAICLTDHLIYDDKINQTVKQSLAYPKEGITNAKKSTPEYAYPVIHVQSNLTILSIQHAADQIFHLIGGANFVEKVNSSDEKLVVIDNFHNCPNCLKWNKDWCNFINEPIILGKTPRQLVTKDQQCWCHNSTYYFDNESHKTIEDICRNGFECHSNKQNETIVTTALNGTPCDENKVCWNNECVGIAS